MSDFLLAGRRKKCYYSKNILEIFEIWNGGLAIHGGIIGGVLWIVYYCKKKNVNILKITDVLCVSLILAQAIGRWGNFMNHEAHGGAVSSDFISRFPEFIQKGMLINGSYYHPTFLYESVFDVLICLILIYILFKKKKQHGIVLGAYLILYSSARFFIEGLRTDSLMFMGLRIAQVISIVGIILGAIIIFISIKKAKSNNI